MQQHVRVNSQQSIVKNHLSKKDIFGVKSEMQKESEGGAGVSESESQGIPPLTSPLGAVYCQDPA